METFNDLIAQLGNLSVGAQVVGMVLVAGYIIKAIPQVPNTLIPLITLAVAVAANVLLGDMGAVSPTQRHPQVQLGVGGAMYWGLGWLIHSQGLSRLEKLLPAPLKAFLGVGETPPKQDDPPASDPMTRTNDKP